MEANGFGTPLIQPQYRFTVTPVRLGWQGHEPLEFFLYFGDVYIPNAQIGRRYGYRMRLHRKVCNKCNITALN